MALSTNILLLALGTAYFANCSAFETGALTGAVKDAVTGASLGNVEVRVPLWSSYLRVDYPKSFKGNLKSDDEFVYTYAHTSDQGTYSLDIPMIGATVADYNVQFSAPNYPRTTINNVDVRPGERTIVEELSYIDKSRSGQGTASGIVKNALTGRPEQGVTGSLRSGNNVKMGSVIRNVVTGSDGSWSVSLETGYYTAEFHKLGFVTVYKTVICIGNGQVVGNQHAKISPDVPVGETRVVLGWDLSPRDLDSHMTGPTPFHVYYGVRGYLNSAPFCFLDVDDVDGSGPETITITKQSSGRYRYSVHDYSNQVSTNSQAMSNSKAHVQLIRGGVTRTFHIPPRTIGTLWTVFEINGNDVTLVNSMTNHRQPSTIQ